MSVSYVLTLSQLSLLLKVLREREVNSSQRGIRDNRELELAMHESTSQLIAKDWKNGVKSKGNRIFFELVGGRVNRVHFSGVVL